MRKPLLFLLFVALTACQTGTEALNVDEVRKDELIAAECSIYFTVEAKLAREFRQANGNMSEGCPPDAAKTVAEIVPSNPTRESDSRYATILYQRMIARGMPKDVVDNVRKSNAFFNLVTRNDEVYGRN